MTPKKQAIIVVHGMGEQRPMGTLRTFVDTLWTTDVKIALDDPQDRDEDGNKSWIVPDIKTGSHDLQRITTPAMQDGRRTDFYEFYYADILDSAKFKNLWRWLLRVIRVKPDYIPERMVWPWTALCFLVTLILWVLLGAAILLLTRFGSVNWPRLDVMDGFINLGALVLVNLVLMIMLAARIPKMRFLLRWPSYGLIGLIVLYPLFFGGDFALQSFFISFPVILSMTVSAIFIPYLGDVAGYMGAHPDTVGRRHEVRERGLKLLRELHKDEAYDRIVIVAHSLGSVVAYDILHLLWEEIGPTNENPPGHDVRVAFAAHDVLARELKQKYDDRDWSAADIERYRVVQSQVSDAIRKAGPMPRRDGNVSNSYWKITDFITAGSPLSHAQFLLARGVENFNTLKKERLFPTCPPQVYNEDYGVLYSDDKVEFVADQTLPQTKTDWAVQAPSAFAHHGAVFSAVRWTNLFDAHHPLFFWQGDVLGGPVGGKGRFGQGIKDVDIPMEYRWLNMDVNFVTHTMYWDNLAAGQNNISENVHTIREAVKLRRD